MVIPVGLGKNSYDIVIERGALERASEIFDLDRKVMIVTDSGVPEKYYCRVAAGCRVSTAGIFQAGEASKTPQNFNPARFLSVVNLHFLISPRRYFLSKHIK